MSIGINHKSYTNILHCFLKVFHNISSICCRFAVDQLNPISFHCTWINNYKSLNLPRNFFISIQNDHSSNVCLKFAINFKLTYFTFIVTIFFQHHQMLNFQFPLQFLVDNHFHQLRKWPNKFRPLKNRNKISANNFVWNFLSNQEPWMSKIP